MTILIIALSIGTLFFLGVGFTMKIMMGPLPPWTLPLTAEAADYQRRVAEENARVNADQYGAMVAAKPAEYADFTVVEQLQGPKGK